MGFLIDGFFGLGGWFRVVGLWWRGLGLRLILVGLFFVFFGTFSFLPSFCFPCKFCICHFVPNSVSAIIFSRFLLSFTLFRSLRTCFSPFYPFFFIVFSPFPPFIPPILPFFYPHSPFFFISSHIRPCARQQKMETRIYFWPKARVGKCRDGRSGNQAPCFFPIL